MISGFFVGGFKSYGDASFPLGPLTLLVGANASGKSNLIEAISLLQWLAHGRRLGDLAYAMRDRELSIRGRLADLPAGESDKFTLGCDVEKTTDTSAMRLSVTIRIAEHGPRIVAEELTAPAEASTFPLYRIEQPAAGVGNEVRVAYNNFARGGVKPQISAIDQQAVFTQLQSPARFDASHTRSQQVIPLAVKQVQELLTNVLLLDPNPKQMRGYAYKDEPRLQSDGANVSAVLHDLCSTEEGEREVLQFVRSLPEQNIAGIRFLEGPRNDFMVQLQETFGDQLIARDAAVLSDGTLRVLAIAAAVLSVRENSLVVIEEIDNGVHPSRAKELLENLSLVAKRRGLGIIVTTHNPALLDATPEDALGAVVACYRDPASGESKLARLSDLDGFAALVAQGPLGWLATSGTLDRYLKKTNRAQEREEQKQTVLSILRGTGS